VFETLSLTEYTWPKVPWPSFRTIWRSDNLTTRLGLTNVSVEMLAEAQADWSGSGEARKPLEGDDLSDGETEPTRVRREYSWVWMRVQRIRIHCVRR
jgi:hypothetical protein